jgi:hypothetical protein
VDPPTKTISWLSILEPRRPQGCYGRDLAEFLETRTSQGGVEIDALKQRVSLGSVLRTRECAWHADKQCGNGEQDEGSKTSLEESG